LTTFPPSQTTVELTLQQELSGFPLGKPWVEILLENPWQDWCGQWLQCLEDHLPPANSYGLTLLLTDNDRIQSLNQQFRHQDKPTDVLAFAALEVDFPPMESLEMGEPLYLGDIVISLEQADHQAQERGHDSGVEVIWLAAHGLLHLLGWDHPDEASLTTMLSQQSHLLTLIGKNPPQFT
jgi:probable rRNA maturation factor